MSVLENRLRIVRDAYQVVANGSELEWKPAGSLHLAAFR
jgi:hypothetical protein